VIAGARKVFDALEDSGVRVALEGSSVRLLPAPGTTIPGDLIEAARPHKALLITRAKLIEAARAQNIDKALVMAHLDVPDLQGYEGCHDAFLRVAVLAVRDAALRGTCSCDRCKAERRVANGR
jgi:hypothetical protein